MAIIKIPSKLKARLNKEHATIIDHNLIEYSFILNETELFFFPEYTDHGINHIEGVLKGVEKLIADDTYKKLSSLDISAIIIAIVLHDIGMHTSAEMFKNMIDGEYDYIPDNFFKEKTWKELWDEYLKDSRFWNQEKKDNVFGAKDHDIKEPNINDLQSLNEYDRKFIGEFIRLHHARLAYEIALKGYKGKEKPIVFDFTKNHDLNNKKFLQLAGLIARSHGMNVRDTFNYLKTYGKNLWKKPLEIKVVFLMTLIRIADYLQIDATRTNELTLKLRTFYSSYSLREHNTHLAIDYIHFDNDDKEKIEVEASPEDAQMYVKIDNLVQDIQKELDLSWAILGEVYGNEYKLRYRRIVSNLTDADVKDGYDFVPNQFGLKLNSELTKLLMSPLYGSDPSYGVRELVQNAVDACRTRMALDEEYQKQDITHVTVRIDSKSMLFSIVDSGIGMTIEEIEKYFLTIGSSYNDSSEWQKARGEKNKNRDIDKIYRTGRFGIGILAAFLLGPIINVKTRSVKDKKQGYQFTMSLDKEFIQINKVAGLNYGTTIEINCNDEIIHKMQHSNWSNWYINHVPLVKYYCDGRHLLPYHINSYSTYKLLVHSSSEFGDIYWKPQALFTDYTIYSRLNENAALYCNGFLITKKSPKRVFSNTHGIEKYISLKIPSLIVSDIYNRLPLNLQRNSIDISANYLFEKELAIAMCKDVLCQLLAFNAKQVRYSHNFFFSHYGFTINNGLFINIFERNAHEEIFTDSHIKYLQNKTLVHVFNEKDTPFWSYGSLMTFLKKYPDTFITLYDSLHLHSHYYNILSNIINSVRDQTNNQFLNHSCILAVNKKRIQQFVDILSRLNRAKTLKFIKSKEYGNYTILTINPDNNTANASLPIDIINEFSDGPLCFLIYKNAGNDNKSDLDEFFEEYADGDMIIPYNENERRRKFAKIFEECSEDIEKYRQYYL